MLLAVPLATVPGSVAQWQSRGLITPWLQVRILSDPLERGPFDDVDVDNATTLFQDFGLGFFLVGT